MHRPLGGEAKALDDRDVLARAPDGVDGDVERQRAREELGELGQAEGRGAGGEGTGRGVGEEGAEVGGGGGGGEEEGPELGGDEGGVLDEVAEGAVRD